jgi:hypothetical protein
MDEQDTENHDPAEPESETPDPLIQDLTDAMSEPIDLEPEPEPEPPAEDFTPVTDTMLLGVPPPLQPYRVTINWGGAHAGDMVLVDKTQPQIAAAIAKTILVPWEG